MFLFLIYLFIFSKALSGEHWTKANNFSQAALFFVHWERLSQISQLSLCRLSLIGSLFGEKKYFTIKIIVLLLSFPLNVTLNMWLSLEELFVLLKSCRILSVSWVGNRFTNSFQIPRECSSINSFNRFENIQLVSQGGFIRRFNFHNYRSQKNPSAIHTSSDSFASEKTRFLNTTHKCPKMHAICEDVLQMIGSSWTVRKHARKEVRLQVPAASHPCHSCLQEIGFRTLGPRFRLRTSHGPNPMLMTENKDVLHMHSIPLMHLRSTAFELGLSVLILPNLVAWIKFSVQQPSLPLHQSQ